MTKSIHIMHLLPTLGTGGMENGIVNQINNINIEKFKVSVCCLNGSGPMEKRIYSDRARIIVVGQKPGKAYNLSLKLMSIFKKEKVDIVYTHNCYAGIYGGIAAKLLFKPLIHGEHGFDYDLNSGDITNINKERLVCWLANHITCVSASLKDIVCEKLRVKHSKITVIPNGVDFERFSKNSRFSKIIEYLEIKPDSIIIGSVGRLHYQKNYELLIKVFALLCKFYDITLILVGDGPERKSLENLTFELGISNSVKILGEREDIPDLLSVMHIFVLPSFLEGMSNTILEAMSAGLPVIASNVGGNPYIIKDKRSGFLFKLNSQQDLCDKLKKLIEDKKLRETIGDYAARDVKANYSISSMVKEYENLYWKYS